VPKEGGILKELLVPQKFMKETKLSSGIIFLSGTALACAVLFTIFTNCNDSSGKLNKNESDVATKLMQLSPVHQMG
jgi:hypothetical protein